MGCLPAVVFGSGTAFHRAGGPIPRAYGILREKTGIQGDLHRVGGMEPLSFGRSVKRTPFKTTNLPCSPKGGGGHAWMVYAIGIRPATPGLM